MNRIIAKYGLLRNINDINGFLIEFNEVKAGMPLCWVEHGRLLCMEVSKVSLDGDSMSCFGEEVAVRDPFGSPKEDYGGVNERLFRKNFFKEKNLANLRDLPTIGFFFVPTSMKRTLPTKSEMLRILNKRK